jgi:hypothetical protein
MGTSKCHVSANNNKLPAEFAANTKKSSHEEEDLIEHNTKKSSHEEEDLIEHKKSQSTRKRLLMKSH